ncbi:MAG: hypothetical protein EBU81_15350 [Proteobacteria bacterium]|nr:hypothetical protein [Pseudomonadota bacterium]
MPLLWHHLRNWSLSVKECDAARDGSEARSAWCSSELDGGGGAVAGEVLHYDRASPFDEIRSGRILDAAEGQIAGGAEVIIRQSLERDHELPVVLLSAFHFL